MYINQTDEEELETDEEPTPPVGAPAKVTPRDKENIRRKLPRVLTYDEIDRLLASVDDLEDLVGVCLMVFGGLRVEEASELRAQDISLDNKAVFVHQGKGNKDRWAPINLQTLALCNCYVKSVELKPEEPLFHMSKRTLQRHVTDVIYPKAGIVGATCHTLRHTCATWQLDKGIPLEIVKNNLGHESIEVTQIYLHLNIRQRSRFYTDCTRFGI